MDKEIVALRSPIKHGEIELHEVELVEPTIGDLTKMDDEKGDFGKVLVVIGACTRLPPSVIKQLRFRDFRAIGEVAMKFLGEEFPEIGEKPQPGSLISSTGLRPKLNS